MSTTWDPEPAPQPLSEEHRSPSAASLQSNKVWLAGVLAGVMDAILIVDEDYRIVLFNEAAERMFRCPATLAIGQPLDNLIPPRYRLAHREYFRAFAETHVTRRSMGNLSPITGLRADGEEFPIEVSISLLSTGGSAFFLAIIRDITEKRLMEEHLRESERQMRLFTLATNDALWNWDLKTGAVERSQGFETCFGYRSDEIEPGVEWWVNRLHPDDRNRVLMAFHTAAREDLETCSYEYRFQKRDLDYATIIDRVYFVRDETGLAVRALGAMRDITARKQAEEAMRTQKQFFEHFLEHTMAGYCEWWLQEGVRYLSPSFKRMFGYEDHELSNKVEDQLALMLPEDRAVVLDQLRRHIESRGVVPFRNEVRYRHKNGSLVWVIYSGKVVEWNEQEQPIRLIGAHVDITARKQAEEEVKRLNESLERHVSERTAQLAETIQTLEHEITERKLAETAMLASREQLRALAVRLQNIREEERTHIAREIHDDLGQTLTGLKIELVQLSKKQLERQQVEEKLRTLAEQVDEIIKSVQRICVHLRPGVLDSLGLLSALEWEATQFQARTGIRWVKTPMAKIPVLEGERATALYRAFQELLTNVARHAQATEFCVALRLAQGQIELEVADNGRGISQAELTADNALGILGMRERLLAFGGEVHFLGEPGKGTTATVRLPLGDVYEGIDCG
jgi:PAS domain S-box-containing protein